MKHLKLNELPKITHLDVALRSWLPHLNMLSPVSVYPGCSFLYSTHLTFHFFDYLFCLLITTRAGRHSTFIHQGTAITQLRV